MADHDRRPLLPLLGSLLLWYATLGLLFTARFEVSHAYAHALGANRLDLPMLTRQVALPILGGEAAAGAGNVCFVLVWSVLALLPAAALLWALGASGGERAARWALFQGLYVPFVLFVVVATALGLWLPFAPL